MEQKDTKGGAKVFSWTLWRFTASVKFFQAYEKDGNVNLQVRAIASDGEVQNSNIEDLYNIRGILNNANHEINFKLPQ